MWRRLSNLFGGTNSTPSVANITGTIHNAPEALRYDSLDNLLGNLGTVGDQTMLRLPGSTTGLGDFLNNHGGTIFSGLKDAGNLFLGMKQYGMAKDALNESRRQFDVNYDAQRKLTNSRLEDRQRARNAASPGSHMSVEEYMNKYGVS